MLQTSVLIKRFIKKRHFTVMFLKRFIILIHFGLRTELEKRLDSRLVTNVRLFICLDDEFFIVYKDREKYSDIWNFL